MTKKNKRILNEACEHCGHELRCQNCRTLPRSSREAELLELLKEALATAEWWMMRSKEGEMAYPVDPAVRERESKRLAEIRKRITEL